MKNLFMIPVALLLSTQCHFTPKEEPEKTEVEIIEEPDTLPPLKVGEVSYKGDEPFGEIIELKGRHITGDTAIFKARDFIIRDSLLIMYQGFYEPIKLFSYPELKYLGEVGQGGQGPGEYLLPVLINTLDKEAICYVTDENNYRNFLKLTKDLHLEPVLSPLRGGCGHLDNIFHIGNKECFYTEKTNLGASIKRSVVVGDSVSSRELYKLNLREKQNFWGTYLGSLGINMAKNRMVYAYKYYRTIKFMDVEGQQVRTIKFLNEEGFDDNTINMTDGLDRNVVHYALICIGDKYVYISYSGMTPLDKVREGSKGIYITYIEKYDWNGNPICKYKLFQRGYWGIDEKRNQICMASPFYDEPFFVFDLPE